MNDFDEVEFIHERGVEPAGQFGNGQTGAAEELEIGQQEVIDHGGPHLSQDRIAGGADKGFDFEILFDPFEEQFDLPSLFVNGRHGGCGELEVVGQERINLARVRVPILDEPQDRRVIQA